MRPESASSVKQITTSVPHIKIFRQHAGYQSINMKSVFLTFLITVALNLVAAENCHQCVNDEIGIETFFDDPNVMNNTKCLDDLENLEESAKCTRHHVCYKRLIVKDEKTFVERGCLNKTDLGYVIFDDSITDECGSTSMFGSDWSFCVCQGDKCNGGGTVLATITLTVLAALTSKFAY
ncbi:uncharacterized protein LOC131880444 [Tigriopus californicus]|uniref:uncharacterized protein LOC131880444 n=1 Tax=Tigriopus californicus TaxID=6832 RepID=UPI0027D9D427|nr:uncharacterized protein LOC131880444 [Tigriopus californicus]